MIITSLLKNIESLHYSLAQSQHKHIFNISSPYLALLLSQIDEKLIAILPDLTTSESLYHDLIFFRKLFAKSAPVYLPPPDDPFNDGIRSKIFLDISYSNKNTDCIVASQDSLISLPDIQTPYKIETYTEIDRDSFEELLQLAGYQKQALALRSGQYSKKNWIFDIYPVGERYPVRVEFFGDMVESIRIFDPDTQRSIRPIQMFEFYALTTTKANKQFQDYFNTFKCFLNDQCKEVAEGINDLTTFSFLPIHCEGISSNELLLHGLNILPNERTSIDSIKPFVSDTNRAILCVLPSISQCERLKDIFTSMSVDSFIIDIQHLHSYQGRIAIVNGELSSGFLLQDIAVLTDIEIFGQRPVINKSDTKRHQVVWDTFDDIEPGDLIVHKEHGIGKFVSLVRQKTEDFEEDLFMIEYADGDKIYVPFQRIDNIKKYASSNVEAVQLDKLGSKKWKVATQKAKESIKELADRLLKIYAERKTSRGFVFSKDTHIHKEFDEFFPYQLTADQIKAIEEIKKLMYEDSPMDMLVCGDVGYGKTEVAMQSAFRAVYDNKQVAVLAPTTLLVQQHYRTFKTRFEGFPIRIASLTRFDSAKMTVSKLLSLKRGEIDIIIGTHKLLGKNVSFLDLGLLIVDEEHKFGVLQKERIKEICAKVDVITLTATPIPRTLHMALSGIRTITTIETAPEERLSVKTIISNYREDVIVEAIRRELARKGQVFYLYNKIEDMHIVLSRLQRIIPEAKIEIAHAKMSENQIEQIMMGFLDRQTDILLCTTIIGAGIDIANANTIIVENAQNFGLADLYQLRGRVGRSNRQAYAYFIVNNKDSLSDHAKKRIKALQELSYLGAGFRLAMADLEIRGAGNLLGPEQSGHINRVGLDFYLEMLQDAVAELKGDPLPDKCSATFNLRVSAFIPEEYIADVPLRLSVYKRIASIKTLKEADDIQVELQDRFGKPPIETILLVQIIKIKILAIMCGVSKIDNLSGRYSVVFDPTSCKVTPDSVLKVLNAFKKLKYKFVTNGFEIDMRGQSPSSALQDLFKILYGLAQN